MMLMMLRMITMMLYDDDDDSNDDDDGDDDDDDDDYTWIDKTVRFPSWTTWETKICCLDQDGEHSRFFFMGLSRPQES